MSTDTLLPKERWESSPADPTILAEGFRFPYACNIITPNRFIKSALSEHLATFDKNDMSKSGIPTEELINLYRKFAEGGFGIIVTGCIMVNGRDLEAEGNVIIDKDFDSEARREAFKRWVLAGKANGSLMIAQLFHPGKQAVNLPNRSNIDINNYTREEIRKLIEEYAYAAKFAQECGFDGVEICSAYYYTLGQFLTDGDNQRSDEYGGSLENRSRLLFSILHKLRMRLPRQDNFVFGVKLYPGNFKPGYVEDNFADFIHNLEKSGFDYVTFTDHCFSLSKLMNKHAKKEHFYQTVIPEAKKNLTRTKLILTGNIVTLSDMCEAVQKRWAAGIALGKSISFEPDLPKKMLNHEVSGAAKSLIDPGDYVTAEQAAGTQLWQHANNCEVLDTSDPAGIEAFKTCLAEFNGLQLKEKDAGDKSVHYPKMLINEGKFSALAETPLKVQAEPEKFEEEIHEVEEKDLKKVISPIEMHTQTTADSFKSFERRFEDDGNTEITEESFEKVTTSNTDFIEPKNDFENHPPQNTSAEGSGLLSQVAKKTDSLVENFKTGLDELTEKILGKDQEEAKPEETKITVEATEMAPIDKEITEAPLKMDAEKTVDHAKDVVDKPQEGEEDFTVKTVHNEEASKVEKDGAEKSFIEVAKEKGEDLFEDAKETGNDFIKAGKDFIEAKIETGKEYTDMAKDAVKSYFGGLGETSSNLPDLDKPSGSPELREIIAGITSDNKEVISGLQEEQSEPKTDAAEPLKEQESIPNLASEEKIQSNHVAPLETKNEAPSDENVVALPAEGVSSTTDEEKKQNIDTVAAEIADDIEESIQKVILHNISLGGLISDHHKKVHTPRDKQEVVAGITADNQKIISNIVDDNAAPEIPQQFVITTTVGTSKPPAKIDEPLKQPEDSTDNEFKDVKQWLVFTRDQTDSNDISNEPEIQKVQTTSLGKKDNDEYRNVKQWLMFTKQPPTPSSEAAASENEQPTDSVPTIEDHFKHVKQWLVFNRDETPLATVEAEAISTSVPQSLPSLESHSTSEPLVKGDASHSDEFSVADGSSTTHKQMFGSSLQDEKIEKVSPEGTLETVVTQEIMEDVDASKKDDGKKLSGISGFFKSAFTNPVQKLFNDAKDDAKEIEEIFDSATKEIAEQLQPDSAQTHVLNTPDDCTLSENTSEKIITTEPDGTVIEELKVTKTSTEPSNGQETTSTITTMTTKRTQKKRSSKSSKNKKGSFDDHGFDFI